MICPFESMFCHTGVESVLGNVCPNCGGGFCNRPIRSKTNWNGDNSLGARPSETKVTHRPVNPAAHAIFAAPIRKLPPEKRWGMPREQSHDVTSSM